MSLYILDCPLIFKHTSLKLLSCDDILWTMSQRKSKKKYFFLKRESRNVMVPRVVDIPAPRRTFQIGLKRDKLPSTLRVEQWGIEFKCARQFFSQEGARQPSEVFDWQTDSRLILLAPNHLFPTLKNKMVGQCLAKNTWPRGEGLSISSQVINNIWRLVFSLKRK